MTTGQLRFETRTRRSGKAHWRKLDGSEDLQRLLELLLTGERYTPLAISNLAHVMYNPAIWELDAELNVVGISVQHQRVEGKQYHEYWLAPEDLAAARERLRQARTATEGGDYGKQVAEGAQGIRLRPASEAGEAVAGVDEQEEAQAVIGGTTKDAKGAKAQVC